MTSQLNVDTIKDKSGSGGVNLKIANTSTYVSDDGASTQNTVQSLSKAWINQDGTASGAAARDSFNISGVTDTGSGNYTNAFTNNMGNANWTSQISANNGTTDVSGAHDYGFAVVDRAAGSYRIDIENASNTQTDLSLVDTVVNGDLA